MQLILSIRHLFQQLQYVLELLADEQYTQPGNLLSKATIGQHMRHVIELFTELEKGYATGVINYDKRKRDYTLESNRFAAAHRLDEILLALNKPDKPLMLSTNTSTEPGNILMVPTNYYRELIYNMEHTVHHMALIRIGIREVSNIALPEEFGVAASTIQYRKACAQ